MLSFIYNNILPLAILLPNGAVGDIGGALYAIGGAVACE